MAAIVQLVARAVFAPAPVRILNGDEPVCSLANFRGAMIDAAGIERAERGPGAVNIIQAPTSIPTSILQLRAEQILDPTGKRFTVSWRLTELGKHRDTTGRNIFRRRIDQRSMVSVWDIVEIVENVVDV